MADEIKTTAAAFGTVARIIELLDPLNTEDREHVLRTVTTWFRVGISPGTASPELPEAAVHVQQPLPTQDEKFSNRQVLTAKDFVFEKDPRTESERLACLAYYLTHYMETPHFKNIDLSRLNTEAAQRKLSNPAVAAANAIRDGFLVSAPKDGCKQLSAMGERFVHALPNREAAMQIKQRKALRRGKKSGSQGGSDEPELEPQTS